MTNADRRELYFDTSALVKLVVIEPESAALRRWLDDQPAPRRVSSALTRVELVRAVWPHGREAIAEARTRLRKLDLLLLEDDLLDIAAGLEMPDLRSLDAIHVASAMACGPELEAVVTYDRRMAEAARSVGLPVAHPGRRSLADRQ